MDFHNTKKFRKLAKLEKNRILRIFVFTIILFGLMLFIINFLLGEYMRTENYARLYPRNYIVYSIENLNLQNDKKPVVAFIGDSIFKNDGISFIAENYQDFATDISVYDLSAPGTMISYKYLVMKSILNNTDIIILNINYNLFSEDVIKNAVLVDEKLADLTGLDEEDKKFLTVNKETGEFENKVPILNNKQNIQGMFFGGHPRRWIEKIKNDITCKKDCNKAKETENFDQLTEDKKKEVLNSWYFQEVVLNSSNVNFIYLGKISELARKNNKTVIAVITPINPEIKNNASFWGKFKNDTILIKSELNDSVIFIDYSEANIQSSFYTDVVHFTPEGSKVFAEILYNDTKKYLGK